MNTEIKRKEIWESAGMPGLILGLVPCAYTLLNMLFNNSGESVAGNFLSTILAFILWLAKFVGCIWLMKYFMQKFANQHPGIDMKTVFRFGMITALLSALICSVFSFVMTVYINPEQVQEAIDLVMESYSSMLDSNSMTMMESIMSNYATIQFFTNIVYCFLYGTIISRLLSGKIVPSTPFNE